MDWMPYSPPKSGPMLLIPTRNCEGQIVALHQKPHVPDSGKGPGKVGKYMWISNEKSFNLPNHETPLFYCRGIGLVEGGLKAHVLARLSSLHVIGAAGI